MGNEPKVCIIIVNYNTTEDTIACLESLKAVDYSNVDVVLVDNCSRDISALEQYAADNGVHFLPLKENLGFAGGNNVAIKYAREQLLDVDYLLLLNNDTVVDVGFLQPLVAEFARRPSVGACCAHINYYAPPQDTWYGGGGIKWPIGKPYHETASRDDLTPRTVDFLTGCVFMFPARLVEEVGYLDEDYFLYFEDVAFSVDIQRAGYELRYVPESLVYHKVSVSTGYRSPLANYYGTRNNLLFMSRYAKKRHYVTFRCFFLLKNVVKYAVHLAKGKSSRGIRRAIVQAFKDFRNDRVGKGELRSK